MPEYVYRVFMVYGVNDPQCGRIQVIRRTAKQLKVGSCTASGHRSVHPPDAFAATPHEAWQRYIDQESKTYDHLLQKAQEVRWRLAVAREQVKKAKPDVVEEKA